MVNKSIVIAFFRAIWNKQPKLVFKNMMELSERSEDNFILFLKTYEGYFCKIARK